MLSKIYKPEPAAVVELASGEEVQLGFVVESDIKRLGYIFAVEREVGSRLAFDVRKVEALEDVFAGVSRADKSRLRAVGEAISTAFESREALAWALLGNADEFASTHPTH